MWARTERLLLERLLLDTDSGRQHRNVEGLMVATSNIVLSFTSTELQETHTQRAWADHHEPLRRFIARRLPRGSDADDVLQTVFLNFHRHFGSGEAPAANS